MFLFIRKPRYKALFFRTWVLGALAFFPACAISGCGSSCPQPHPVLPTPPKVVKDSFGLAGGFPTGSDPGSTKRRTDQLSLLMEAGVRNLRIDFTWNKIEPAPGEFHFDKYDFVVDEALRYGMQVEGILCYGTPWATTRPILIPGLSATPPPDNPENYRRFASRVASHFQGRVRAWEIWNEPNSGFRFWSPDPGGNPGEYAQLLIAGYQGIKGDPENPDDGACEDCTVVFGGTFHPSTYEFIVPGGLAFINAVHRYAGESMGINLGDYYDVMALHPYMYPTFEILLAPFAAPEDDLSTMGYDPEQGIPQKTNWPGAIRDARTLLSGYGIKKPIWITEFGWPTNFLWPGLVLPKGVSLEEQAAYSVRACVLSLAEQVERLYLFTYKDGDDWKLNQEAAFGLISYDPDYPDKNPNPSPKPAYYAYKTLTEQIGETYFACDLRETLNLAEKTYAFRFLSGGVETVEKKCVTVMWDALPDRRFEAVLPLKYPAEIILSDMFGAPLTPVIVGTGTGRKLHQTLSPAPVYLQEIFFW